MRRKAVQNENEKSTEIFNGREYDIIRQALYDYMMTVDRARITFMIDGASDAATKAFYDEIHGLYSKVIHLQPEEDRT